MKRPAEKTLLSSWFHIHPAERMTWLSRWWRAASVSYTHLASRDLRMGITFCWCRGNRMCSPYRLRLHTNCREGRIGGRLSIIRSTNSGWIPPGNRSYRATNPFTTFMDIMQAGLYDSSLGSVSYTHLPCRKSRRICRKLTIGGYRWHIWIVTGSE